MTDIKLSKRMQAVANMVEGRRVADIGCDHAFVSIYLIQSGRADKIIALDVKEGPINIARENVRMYGLSDSIDVRLSNGFCALEENEADCAVIAGMGGQLMVDIIREGKNHTNNKIMLVLQPQSENHMVRKYLFEIGYEIVCENMLIEDNKYYTIMKAVPSENSITGYKLAELTYGRQLLISKNEVLKRYLLHSKKKNIKIMEKLSRVHTESSNVRVTELNHENEVIQEALNYYNV